MCHAGECVCAVMDALQRPHSGWSVKKKNYKKYKTSKKNCRCPKGKSVANTMKVAPSVKLMQHAVTVVAVALSLRK